MRIRKTFVFLSIVFIVTSFCFYFIFKDKKKDKVNNISKPNYLERSAEYQLMNLGLAVQMYVDQYKGQLPPDLGILIDRGYCENREFYVIAGTETKLAIDGNDIRKGQCDILYFGNESMNLNDYINRPIPILATKTGALGGGKMIVTTMPGCNTTLYFSPPEYLSNSLKGKGKIKNKIVEDYESLNDISKEKLIDKMISLEMEVSSLRRKSELFWIRNHKKLEAP